MAGLDETKQNIAVDKAHSDAYISVSQLNNGEEMELMGLYEIANLAGVTPQAVSNWVKRKMDFPKPVATLASGPVWEGKAVRAWLGTLHSSNTRSKGAFMSEFVVDQEYTHADIVSALGGDTVSYLPQSEGRIVGGRFKAGKINPNAPYEILVGDLPRVRQKAELLAAQGGTIPVFMKEAPNRWCYHGRMECAGYETGSDAIESTAGAQDRVERVAGVLKMKDA